jgi:hypothetical protein
VQLTRENAAAVSRNEQFATQNEALRGDITRLQNEMQMLRTENETVSLWNALRLQHSSHSILWCNVVEASSANWRG